MRRRSPYERAPKRPPDEGAYPPPLCRRLGNNILRRRGQRDWFHSRGAPCRAPVQTRLPPQLASDLNRVDACLLPPGAFIADMMGVSVMCAAERDDEFVAHLSA